jgi:hypothetical protein
MAGAGPSTRLGAGAWLISLARRVLHDDTFEMMVSPAIADLQFEAAAGHARSQSYLGVWTALAGALAHDFDGDVRTLADDASTLASLVCIQACYYTALVLFGGALATKGAFEPWLGAPGGFVAALATIFVLMAAISTIPTLLCFWPDRRCSSC